MKKKIFAAILAAAMVMSLTACGKDTKVTSSVEEVVEEAVASVEEAAEEVVEEAVEEVAAEETAEEDVDITGTIDGNVYTNEFFGFKVEAAEGYTFADDNLKDTIGDVAQEKIEGTDTALGKLASQKVKEGGQVVDFYLADSTFLNTLNLTMSYLGSSSINQESMESIMSIMLPSLKETYEQMGFSDLTCEMSTTTVMGKDTPCIVLQGKGESEGITFDMYINQAFMVKDGYMACFTAGTALEDHRDDLLAMISSLE
ncbi:MAG: hypothetical protein J6X48_06330 [Lachnospiraceae bacterium]|nr:hypothetical protein [Lachnospiraceae bacterium]